MCGIAAICGPTTAGDEAIQRMVTALRHRGPDAQTWRSLAGCQLGHTRLSIIDLASGAQPMADRSGRYWITFNGEIYNYRELRDELAADGVTFNTHSDTEVILAAYAHWGRAMLNRLRGMYAFVIWDTHERRVFAARDLFGEKPLYYAVANGRLLVGSEIRALIASRLMQPVLARDSVDAYLALGYVPPHRTIYANVHTLPPAHCLEWTSAEPRITRYWSPQPRETRDMDLSEAGEALRDVLRRAVQRQMVADVPVGAFLSGGHDSSTIVAYMSELSERPIKTFSVGFGPHVNELPYARRIAELYGTDHHELDLAEPEVAPLLERMAEVYDEPFSDPSHVPTYVVSQFARQQVKVVLTGDGADELFGGYAWYPLLAMSERVPPSVLAWMVLRSASRLIADRVAPLSSYSRAMGMAVRWPDMWQRYVISRQIFRDDDRRTLWGRVTPPSLVAALSAHRPGDEVAGLNRALHFDVTAFLPGDILVKVDRASMAHGLETRAPFLDRELAEFALSLPANLKVDGERTKILFKQALARHWPDEIRQRRKQGFAAPFASWLRRDDVQQLCRRVFASGSPLAELLPGSTRDVVGRSAQKTWCLLTLGLWLERQQFEIESIDETHTVKPAVATG